MQFAKLLALFVITGLVPCQSLSMMKQFAWRSLSASGVPDPMCKTGVISLKVTGQPQSCCASYCGECSDYPTCKSVRGMDSQNACCASKVYEMRCGNAPANACLKKCSEAVPPCIMDEDVITIEPAKHNAADDCTKAVSDWRTSADNAIEAGKKYGAQKLLPTTTTTTTTTTAGMCGLGCYASCSWDATRPGDDPYVAYFPTVEQCNTECKNRNKKYLVIGCPHPNIRCSCADTLNIKNATRHRLPCSECAQSNVQQWSDAHGSLQGSQGHCTGPYEQTWRGKKVALGGWCREVPFEVIYD